MGVVHHGAYLTWFEIGRTELIRRGGTSYRQLEEMGISLAVIEIRVNYKAPARYDDLLELTTTLEEVGRVKIRHSYELKREDQLLTTATTTLACIGADGRPMAVPPQLIDAVPTVEHQD